LIIRQCNEIVSTNRWMGGYGVLTPLSTIF